MKKVVLVFLIGCMLPLIALGKCNEKLQGLDHRGEIYVLCDDLTGISKSEASKIIRSLFDTYEGPDAEIPVFFITSKELVGVQTYNPDQLVGFYYTHNNLLEIWPYIESKKEIIEIEW